MITAVLFLAVAALLLSSIKQSRHLEDQDTFDSRERAAILHELHEIMQHRPDHIINEGATDELPTDHPGHSSGPDR